MLPIFCLLRISSNFLTRLYCLVMGPPAKVNTMVPKCLEYWLTAQHHCRTESKLAAATFANITATLSADVAKQVILTWPKIASAEYNDWVGPLLPLFQPHHDSIASCTRPTHLANQSKRKSLPVQEEECGKQKEQLLRHQQQLSHTWLSK